jgi:glucose-6-phosphate 1-dehydrogenase
MSTTGVSFTPETMPAGRGAERRPDPCVVVIFGASGDLTKRKLLPALFHLEQAGMLPTEFAVLGVARRPLGEKFAQDMEAGIQNYGGVSTGDGKLGPFVGRVRYHAMNFDDDAGYAGLQATLDQMDKELGTKGNRLIYLATSPEYFSGIIERMGTHGLNRPGAEGGWVRIIIEKPFGRDLDSARDLNDEVNRVFREEQVFRIDHYLGKETVQNILVFRFANGIFENVWNRNYVDHVQITAAETLGIEGRGPFYERAGALRDVVQNHIMQLVSFVAMEPPVSFDAEAVRLEKMKVWQAMQQIPINDTARGQYGAGQIGGEPVIAYRDEDRVDADSQTETYAALKLYIENWRWAGVPFYVRAGKRMARRSTEITIQFKQPPLLMFKDAGGACGPVEPNRITMRIQPDEGIALRFGAKAPGPHMNICPVTMDFNYEAAFGGSSATGYERLLLDAMLGDGTLFAHRDGVEATWALITPILEAWQHRKKNFPNYAAGTWGPEVGDDLIERDGRHWLNH